MKEFNAENYLVQRGWVKPDGTPDVKKITEDVYILENAEKMFKSGWTQAKEKAKMDIIGKDIKNINLDTSPTTFDAKGGNPYDFGDYVLSL
jgi:biotin synthase-like enzyme